MELCFLFGAFCGALFGVGAGFGENPLAVQQASRTLLKYLGVSHVVMFG